MTAKQDAKLTSNNDLQLDSDGDILTEDFFDTSLLMSLFTERRAVSSEVPDPQLRRGWIGNESTPGFEIGSKLWLFQQARLTRDTLNGIETAIVNGLQWLVDDELAINTNVSANVANGIITVQIIIDRTNSAVERRHFELWNNTGVA